MTEDYEVPLKKLLERQMNMVGVRTFKVKFLTRRGHSGIT